MTAAARALTVLLLIAMTPARSTGPGDSGTVRWRIEARESRVQFWVRLFGLVPLTGYFPSIDGAILVDAAADRARVEADVAAGAVRMTRDAHTQWARSPEFFDAASHPTIRFESDAFPLARLATGGAIQGRLSLRGKTRPVAFRIERARCDGIAAPRPETVVDSRRCRVELAGAIDRSEFGMRTRGGTVGNRVRLRFHIATRAVAGR